MFKIQKGTILLPLIFIFFNLTSCASFHKPMVMCDPVKGCQSTKEDSVSDVINSLGSVTNIVNTNK